jgi:hypothetical protein
LDKIASIIERNGSFYSMDLRILSINKKNSTWWVYGSIIVTGIISPLYLNACKGKEEPFSQLEPPALHRLTNIQIDNSLKTIFQNEGLPAKLGRKSPPHQVPKPRETGDG